MTNDELTINPEKKKEIERWVSKRLYKKNLSEMEEAKLFILCALLTGFSPKELRRMLDKFSKSIPKNLSKKEIEKRLDEIFLNQVLIQKKKKNGRTPEM